MNREFAHTITLLRKEKKLSQKEAAQALGVSQALLSHYEKGIRECGLSFVVKAADFYGVSCDYLLGRTAERLYDIAELTEDTPTFKKQNAANIVNRRLLDNTAGILYDILSKAGNRKLTRTVTGYLMLGYYKTFRTLCHPSRNTADEMFTVSKDIWRGYTSAAQEKAFTDIEGMANADSESYVQALGELNISPEQLAGEYAEAAGSLFNVIRHAENAVNKMK